MTYYNRGSGKFTSSGSLGRHLLLSIGFRTGPIILLFSIHCFLIFLVFLSLLGRGSSWILVEPIYSFQLISFPIFICFLKQFEHLYYTHLIWRVFQDESGQLMSHINHPSISTSNATLWYSLFFLWSSLKLHMKLPVCINLAFKNMIASLVSSETKIIYTNYFGFAILALQKHSIDKYLKNASRHTWINFVYLNIHSNCNFQY